MYKFSDNVSICEYDKFIKNYDKAPITQDYRWADVKNNWENTICGLYKDNVLIAASLLLIKKFPLGIRMIYSPRGFLIDYNDLQVLKNFTQGIKKYAKKINAFVIKIDPVITIKEQKLEYIKKEIDYDDSPKNYIINEKIIIDNLKSVGFKHQGYKKGLHDYIQPRYNMVINLINKEKKFFTENELLSNFKRNARRYYGKFCEERGIDFIVSNDNEYIDDFLRIINSTEERQGIKLRDKNYFERLMKSFNKDSYIFFARLNIDKYLEFIEEEIKNIKNKDNIEKLIAQKEEAINIKSKMGSKVLTAATLAIVPPNKKGIKKVEYLYAGTDANLFAYLNSNASVHIFSFIYFLKQQYHYADLGGVEGSLNDHLTNTKEKYNPMLFELVGEFDLTLNPFVKFIFSKFNKVLKKIYRKLFK